MPDEAFELFKRKLKTGQYEHYSEKDLASLYMDCIKQTETMRKCNEQTGA